MTDQNYALTHLYHPTGTKVDVPLSLFDELTVTQATTLIRSVDALLLAGFTVNLPGLNDGEQYEQIGFAVRRSKENDDHTTTPIVDIYPVTGTYRILGLYLNTAIELNAFESATGLHIAAMPEFDGTPIERGAKSSTDKYVISLASPAKVVWKLNPKWEGDNDKKHAKRVFVRWDGIRPSVKTAETQLEVQPEVQHEVELSETIERAKLVLTPGGKKMSSLTLEQLQRVANSSASNVTEDMRNAASVLFQGAM